MINDSDKFDRPDLVKTPIGDFYMPADDLISRVMRQSGYHTIKEKVIFESNLVPRGGVVLDVGGHTGTFAIPIANIRKATVHSFEPNDLAVKLFERNIALNKAEDKVFVHFGVVYDREAKFVIKNRDDRLNGRKKYSSATFQAIPSQNGESIPVYILDDFVKVHDLHVDLVKIDCEGAELAAIRSMQKLMTEQAPRIYLEVNELTASEFGYKIQDIEDILRSHGYNHFYMNSEKGADGRRLMNVSSEVTKLNSLLDGQKAPNGKYFFDAIVTKDESWEQINGNM